MATKHKAVDGMRRCQACETHDEHERCTRGTTLGTDQQGLGDVCGCSCPQATVHREAMLKLKASKGRQTMKGNDLSLAAWGRVSRLFTETGASNRDAFESYAKEWALAMEGMASNKLKARIEWELWRSLCGLLRDIGAITDDDLKSPRGSSETVGSRLLEALRQWGDQRYAIGLAKEG